jgi:hypothetical protein
MKQESGKDCRDYSLKSWRMAKEKPEEQNYREYKSYPI